MRKRWRKIAKVKKNIKRKKKASWREKRKAKRKRKENRRINLSRKGKKFRTKIMGKVKENLREVKVKSK